MTCAPLPIRRLARDERGSALFIAIVAMGLMLMLGLTTLSLTDQQTRQSGVERVRESAFNLAEGALQQQSFLLGGRGWPKTATDALPAQCDQQSDPALPVNTRCPAPASLVTAAGGGAYQGQDYGPGVTWKTYVRDNVSTSPQQYTSAVESRPRWDADADGFIWVRSTATIRGRTRTIVALLKRDPIPILMPKAVLVAGSLSVGQNGQSPVIVTNATTPPVLRCDASNPNCAAYIKSGGKKDPQIAPDQVTYNPSFPNLVPTDTVEKLVDSAKLFTSCPTEAQAQGLVVIDVPDTVTCRFTSNAVFNSPSNPGLIIMRRGTLEFAGSGQFYGMLLHLNEGGRKANQEQCIRIPGTVDVYGGIVIEGACGMYITGNARLTFDPNKLNFSVTGVAGLVQNTWRELPPS